MMVEKVVLAVNKGTILEALTEDEKELLSHAETKEKGNIKEIRWEWTDEWGHNGGDSILNRLEEEEIPHAYCRVQDDGEGTFYIDKGESELDYHFGVDVSIEGGE